MNQQLLAHSFQFSVSKKKNLEIYINIYFCCSVKFSSVQESRICANLIDITSSRN